MARRTGGGGTRKHGRNRLKCERYRREHRREKNKLRRILKIKKQNKHIVALVERLTNEIRGR